MQKPFFLKVFLMFIVCCLTVGIWITGEQGARAVNNPELLPSEETPIVDLAKFLPDKQEQSLIQDIKEFEAETGWKLRILTQYDRSPGRAVVDFWNLDKKSILLVADARGGNLLAFSVGDDVYELMPRTFWIELQSRFGNMYYVRDNGENEAIVQSLNIVKGCLTTPGGCSVVPGLPREQWILTLISSIVGGIICGFAAVPRKEGSGFAWQWMLIMSPLWGILFISFGLGPVLVRTDEWLPIMRNVLGFGLGALVAYLSPVLSPSNKVS
jgi:hypothetical protein